MNDKNTDAVENLITKHGFTLEGQSPSDGSATVWRILKESVIVGTVTADHLFTWLLDYDERHPESN